MFTFNYFFSGENAKLFRFPVSVPQEQSTKVNRTAAAKCIQRTTSRKSVTLGFCQQIVENISSENSGNLVCR